jgi:hypothetical protein
MWYSEEPCMHSYPTDRRISNSGEYGKHFEKASTRVASLKKVGERKE